MRCAGQPGVLSSRAVLRTALRVALVKDQRDEPMFDEIFDAFFALVRVGGEDTGHGHSHAHDDLVDSGELESFTLSEEPSDNRNRVTNTASPPASGTTSSRRTWLSSTTCTRKPTRSTSPR